MMDFSDKYDPGQSTHLELTAEHQEQIGQVLGSNISSVQLMPGGFSTSNLLLVLEAGDRFVLRLAADHHRLRKEAAIMSLVSSKTVLRVPEIIWCAAENSAVAGLIMEYVDGVPLGEAEESFSNADAQVICEQVAIAAAEIHSLHFPVNGFLGHDAQVVQPFDSYMDGTLGFLQSCLENDLFVARAGKGRLRRLKECLSSRTDLHEPSQTRQLCHGDFNQKNILVYRTGSGKSRLSAILDWEFALVASGVIDIGNLLRFEDESKSVTAHWFADAYLAAGGILDPGWREQSMFADLLAQCSFLTTEEDKPLTHETAKRVLDRYLDALL